MLRIGLKNDEKQMLVQTINELRELRTELSVLKDKLGRMVADEKEYAWEEVAVGTETGLLVDDEIYPEIKEYLEKAATAEREPDKSMPETDGDESGMVYEGAAPVTCGISDELPEKEGELCSGQGRETENKAVPDEPVPMQEYYGQPGDEPESDCALKKEWAVVDFYGIKRPWWRLLFTGNKS